MGKTVEIFTDGACRGNPGAGGWGAILRYGDKERHIHGGERDTTNNRMEMMAAIQALALLTRPCKVTLTTDSQYLRKGITEWLPNWKKRNWLTASRKPVKNVDLWQQLDKLAKEHEIQWLWVKGHAGHTDNEKADELARRGADEVAG